MDLCNDIYKHKKGTRLSPFAFEVRGGVEPPWPVLQTGD